ncbi:MAG TPA: T9SS type A sorting domain-containing protein [Bacteroidia bacterium]|nr:T9SS type A sorting domain-containing protein [Bacteroidia bacterium]
MKAIKLLFCIPFLVFGFSFCQGQSWLWGRQGDGGLKSINYGSNIATDKFGNAYSTGFFDIQMKFDTVTLTSTQVQSYVVKYNSAGNLIWVKESVGIVGGVALSASIASDTADNIYITGYCTDYESFDSYNLSAPGIFLVKYNSSGNVLWVVEGIVNGHLPYGYAVNTSREGNVYITGTFWDSLSFGPYNLGSPSEQDVYLAKYNSSGNLVWAKQGITPSSSSTAIGYAVSTDKYGNTYLTGAFKDTIIFGTFRLVTNSPSSVFLVKYDSNGNVIWAKQSTGAGNATAYGLNLDEAGNIYITGGFNGTSSFGSHVLNSNGISIFLVKYGKNGNTIWANTSTGGNWAGYSISEESNNHIFLVGSGNGDSLVFANKKIVSNNAEYAFLMELDTTGNMLCSSVLENGACGSYNTNPKVGVASYSTPELDYVYLASTFTIDSVFCGPDTLIPVNSLDAPYIARWQNCLVETTTIPLKSSPSPLSLFPNPSTGIFTIAFVGARNFVPATIEIYNVLGEKVYSQSTIHKSQFTIDISNQPSGIYLYRVLNADGTLLGEGKAILLH